jgi:hypothetical protein
MKTVISKNGKAYRVADCGNTKKSFDRVFRKRNPNIQISYHDYVRISKKYNEFIIQKVLDGHIVTIPGSLGKLRVIGRRVRPHKTKNGRWSNIAPDMVWFRKQVEENPDFDRNRMMYFTNEQTNGIRYKFVWSKKTIADSNKEMYTLRMTRKYKRQLSARIKSGKEYYIDA